jgi:hypothetical protein
MVGFHNAISSDGTTHRVSLQDDHVVFGHDESTFTTSYPMKVGTYCLVEFMQELRQTVGVAMPDCMWIVLCHITFPLESGGPFFSSQVC